MKAQFIGDPRHNGDGPAVLRLHGVDFPKDQWVDPIPASLEAKLPGHSHFLTAESGEGGLVTVQAPDAPLYVFGEGSTEVDPQFAAFDHDGDGAPGGSTASPEKDAVIQALEAYPGVKFDRRWGLQRLRAALEVAQFERGDD